MAVDLLVGEANDFVTSLFQPGCARLIVFLLQCVARPINLNDQSVRNAAEIGDEGANRMLTPELEAIELLAS